MASPETELEMGKRSRAEDESSDDSGVFVSLLRERETRSYWQHFWKWDVRPHKVHFSLFLYFRQCVLWARETTHNGVESG